MRRLTETVTKMYNLLTYTFQQRLFVLSVGSVRFSGNYSRSANTKKIMFVHILYTSLHIADSK